MKDDGPFLENDVSIARALLTAHPFATLVSSGAAGLHASHLPCLLDPINDPGRTAEPLVLEGHIARGDPQVGNLKSGAPALLIFMGNHGYISAGWYGAKPGISTWDYQAVHVYGVPTVLEDDQSLELLCRTMEHFERQTRRPRPVVGKTRELAESLVTGTCCFRLTSSRVIARRKLSQNQAHEVRMRVAAELDVDGPYQHQTLAREVTLHPQIPTRRDI